MLKGSWKIGVFWAAGTKKFSVPTIFSGDSINNIQINLCILYSFINKGRNLFVFGLIGRKKRNKKLIGYDMLYSGIGAYPYYIHTKSKMFLLLPCATVKDKVTIPAVGDAVKIAHEMNKAR